MINKIAKMHNSWFTKIVLVITSLSFMSLFGVSGYINSAASNKAVIQVDDIMISQSEFSYMLQHEISRIRSITGNYDEDNADEFKAKIASLLANTKLNEAIIENTMRKNKIDFSQSLIAQIISVMPEFNYNGKFDKQLYDWYLKNNNKSENELVQDIKRNMAQKLLIDIPLAKSNVPQILQKQMEKMLGQRRTFKYIIINKADSVISRQPSAEELDQFYEDMAEELIIPEKRDVSLMYISQEALENAIEVSPEEISAYYKEHIDEFEQPEQRDVLQMVFEDEDSAKHASAELASGIDFLTVALANGQNPDDINLGYVSKNDVSDDLAEVVFSLSPNVTSAPVQIADSWQIIKVNAVKAATKTDKAQAEQQIIKEIRQEKAYDGSYEILSAIEDKLGAGTPLEQIAAAYNAPIYKIIDIDEEGNAAKADASIKDVLKNRDLIETIFSYNEGEATQVVETDDGLAVALIDKIHDAHQQPREEAEDKLRQMWAESELTAITQEKIDNIEHDAEAGDDLTAIAKRYNFRITNSRPLSRAETIERLDLNQMKTLFNGTKDEPIVIALGDDYIVAATSNIYDDSGSLTAQEKSQLTQLLYNNVISQMSDALLKDFASKYKVKVEYGRIGLND